MPNLPIFQMILVPGLNDIWELNFSEETEDYVQPVFVIPQKAIDHWGEYDFDLPGELEGKYVNYTLRQKNSLLSIEDKRLNHTVNFSIYTSNFNLPGYSYFPPWFYEYSYLNYTGKRLDVIKPYSEKFILIEPIDLLVMDELFQKQSACFVGYTPTFGNR